MRTISRETSLVSITTPDGKVLNCSVLFRDLDNKFNKKFVVFIHSEIDGFMAAYFVPNEEDSNEGQIYVDLTPEEREYIEEEFLQYIHDKASNKDEGVGIDYDYAEDGEFPDPFRAPRGVDFEYINSNSDCGDCSSCCGCNNDEDCDDECNCGCDDEDCVDDKCCCSNSHNHA